MGRFLQISIAATAGMVQPALSIQPTPPKAEVPMHAQPRLVSEQAAWTPGATLWVGVSFKIDPHWHLYWPGQNDSGYNPAFEWSVPEGFKVGTPVWPAPKRLVLPGDILDHVYEDRVTILVPVTTPASAGPDALTISAKVKWLVCERVCLPERTEISLTLPKAAEADKAKPSPDAALFAEARRRVPKPLAEAHGEVTAQWTKGEVIIEHHDTNSESPEVVSLAFYPTDDSTPIDDLVRRGEAKGGKLTLTPSAAEGRVKGVVEVRTAGGESPRWFSVDVPLGTGTK